MALKYLVCLLLVTVGCGITSGGESISDRSARDGELPPRRQVLNAGAVSLESVSLFNGPLSTQNGRPRIAWEVVQGASSYHYVISQSQTCDSVIKEGRTLGNELALEDDLTAGQYFICVRPETDENIKVINNSTTFEVVRGVSGTHAIPDLPYDLHQILSYANNDDFVYVAGLQNGTLRLVAFDLGKRTWKKMPIGDEIKFTTSEEYFLFHSEMVIHNNDLYLFFGSKILKYENEEKGFVLNTPEVNEGFSYQFNSVEVANVGNIIYGCGVGNLNLRVQLHTVPQQELRCFSFNPVLNLIQPEKELQAIKSRRMFDLLAGDGALYIIEGDFDINVTGGPATRKLYRYDIMEKSWKVVADDIELKGGVLSTHLINDKIFFITILQTYTTAVEGACGTLSACYYYKPTDAQLYSYSLQDGSQSFVKSTPKHSYIAAYEHQNALEIISAAKGEASKFRLIWAGQYPNYYYRDVLRSLSLIRFYP